MRHADRDLITKGEAATLTGYSERGLDKLILEGDFPRPFRFSSRRVRFDRDEVLAWREGRRVAG